MRVCIKKIFFLFLLFSPEEAQPMDLHFDAYSTLIIISLKLNLWQTWLNNFYPSGYIFFFGEWWHQYHPSGNPDLKFGSNLCYLWPHIQLLINYYWFYFRIIQILLFLIYSLNLGYCQVSLRLCQQPPLPGSLWQETMAHTDRAFWREFS